MFRIYESKTTGEVVCVEDANLDDRSWRSLGVMIRYDDSWSLYPNQQPMSFQAVKAVYEKLNDLMPGIVS